MTTTTSSTFRRSSSRNDAPIEHRVGALRIRCSTVDDGDFHRTEVPIDELERRRRAFVDLPWTMLDQRHGTTVVRVDAPGDGDGLVGDIAVTTCDDAVLGCWVGDCAPIVLVGASRAFAVVHAGWRGLAAGVIDRAVGELDEPVVAAVLGPTIGPCCYEFGADDLRLVARGVHTASRQIAAMTTVGSQALDMAAAVRAACAHRHIEVTEIGGCTGCTYPGFSHRVRRDPQRHVVAAWHPAAEAT